MTINNRIINALNKIQEGLNELKRELNYQQNKKNYKKKKPNLDDLDIKLDEEDRKIADEIKKVLDNGNGKAEYKTLINMFKNNKQRFYKVYRYLQNIGVITYKDGWVYIKGLEPK
jgi:uncharacterized protein involved in exopolysaccharide biosynthesis